MEETMMDIVGDENSDIIKKQRMMRWDKAKRKYVQTTVGEELSGDSKSKKLRTESGRLVKNNKLKLGELYQKWQKRTNRSIGRTGVFDDNDGPADAESTSGRRNKGSKPSVPTKGQDDDEQVKTAAHIKKNRDKKQNMKIKNMKKGDRRHLEQKSKVNAGRNSGGKSFGKGKGAKKR
jgi:DBP10CT (NUC160) domain